MIPPNDLVDAFGVFLHLESFNPIAVGTKQLIFVRYTAENIPAYRPNAPSEFLFLGYTAAVYVIYLQYPLILYSALGAPITQKLQGGIP
jgi:hypothetical protein